MVSIKLNAAMFIGACKFTQTSYPSVLHQPTQKLVLEEPLSSQLQQVVSICKILCIDGGSEVLVFPIRCLVLMEQC